MNYNLEKLGVTVLNQMQEEMLHTYKENKQVVLLSPTGSGKTLAYLLPLLSEINVQSNELQALVIVPSRELAIQTNSVFKSLATGARAYACYGGRPAMDEHRTMRSLSPHLIVGTPGRILDHLQKRNFLSSSISTLVIDEFDKCLELGFRQQMADIVGLLDYVQRRVLISATDNPDIPYFLASSPFVRVDHLDRSSEGQNRIRFNVVASPQKDKLETLLRLLCERGQQKTLIFVNYRESVQRVADYLARSGVFADAFHGGMEQRDREKALYRFSNGSCNVLVSTDLASRGLDITDVDNVVHYHLPPTEDSFVHRNGRTARWMSEGTSWLILGPEEHMPPFVSVPFTSHQLSATVTKPLPPMWVTLYIGKGKKDKVNKIDVVGFLTKVGALAHEEIGRVDVLPNWAFAAVSRKAAPMLLKRVKGQKIKGKKTIIELAE